MEGQVTLDKRGMITLREAYDRWRHETGIANADDRYRRCAQQGGKVFEFNAPYGARGSARRVGSTCAPASMRPLESTESGRRQTNAGSSRGCARTGQKVRARRSPFVVTELGFDADPFMRT